MELWHVGLFCIAVSGLGAAIIVYAVTARSSQISQAEDEQALRQDLEEYMRDLKEQDSIEKDNRYATTGY